MHTLTRSRATATLVFPIVMIALALAGCGSSVDPALVESAGKQGTILETNYVLLAKDVLNDASTRNLKDVNAAIDAGDPRKATPGDLRRAEREIERRIDAVVDFRKSITTSNRKLRKTPLPDFEQYLDESADVESFSTNYEKTTKTIQRAGTVAITASTLATQTLEKYLDFLEQWEEFVTNDDTAGLESSANASDKAVARFERRKASLERQGDVASQVNELVSDMADDASNDGQISSLIDSLKDEYPKSFLAIHIVEE